MSHQVYVLLYLSSGVHAYSQYLCADIHTQDDGDEQKVCLPSAVLAGDSEVTLTQERDFGAVCGSLPTQDIH